MILVFGKTGQVGSELLQLSGITALGREDVDLADPSACAAMILHHRPKAVINAAAFTAVDNAEVEELLATSINGYAPTVMAETCAKLEIPLVHISTDYVFDGSSKNSWLPDDATAPQNAYGRTKLLGEIGIKKSGATHAILRTSWVFSPIGRNFFNTMLQLSEKQESLNVVADQIGGPTPAREIAVACLNIAKQLIDDPSKSGIYHFSGAPDVSWANFAKEIFAQAGREVEVRPIPSSDYPTPAKRPLNSRLDCSSTEQVFGIPRPAWRFVIQEILKDLKVPT